MLFWLAVFGVHSLFKWTLCSGSSQPFLPYAAFLPYFRASFRPLSQIVNQGMPSGSSSLHTVWHFASAQRWLLGLARQWFELPPLSLLKYQCSNGLVLPICSADSSEILKFISWWVVPALVENRCYVTNAAWLLYYSVSCPCGLWLQLSSAMMSRFYSLGLARQWLELQNLG